MRRLSNVKVYKQLILIANYRMGLLLLECGSSYEKTPGPDKFHSASFPQILPAWSFEPMAGNAVKCLQKKENSQTQSKLFY